MFNISRPAKIHFQTAENFKWFFGFKHKCAGNSDKKPVSKYRLLLGKSVICT